MQYTLLEIVQTVLSSMDSDEINSIGDTIESQQVVEVVKTVYNDIISRADLELYKTPFNLGASNDTAKPVIMYKPSNIKSVDWVKYNCIRTGETTPAWADMQYIPMDQFLSRTQSMDITATDVDTLSITADGFSFSFAFKNSFGPSFYTVFSDGTLVFDAYDSAVDSTLQSTKTWCYGSKNVSFQETDTYVPVLSDDQFSLLINEAKALAWAELKQTVHQKAERTANKNWVHLAKSRRHIPSPENATGGAHARVMGPYFGRK